VFEERFCYIYHKFVTFTNIKNILHIKEEAVNRRLCVYMIQLCGGASEYLLKMHQLLQNKAVRFVTKLDIFTSQEKLLKQCGWLSVKQLVDFHSLVMLFKTKVVQKPAFLQKTLRKTFNYRTSAAIYSISGDIAKSAFICRSTKLWNTLPTHVKQAESLRKFKCLLKI
jgi:hypothetical protein